MSNTWPFSSFGLEEEILDENEIHGDTNVVNYSTDDKFNDEDDEVEDDIFFTDKPKPPLILNSKPMKRFFPNFKRHFDGDIRLENIPVEKKATMVVNKRQSANEANKCKWTKSRAHPVNSRFLVKAKEMKEFFRLTDDPVINDFMKMDSCKRLADKYLIAMVFAYFKRADFDLQEYNRTNFFIALYLAHDVEEDEEEIKHEIFPWALGKQWRDNYVNFLRKKDALFSRIDYKAIISRKCCEEIINIEPDHLLWKRERALHHAGAIRGYMKDPRDNGIPRGPDASPLLCPECDTDSECDSQYDDESSSNSLAWLISPGVSSKDS